MSWREFAYLLEGLDGETPLGRIVNIRAENNPENLKEFTPEQKQIRNEYRIKQAKHKTAEQTDKALDNIKKAFIQISK